MSIRDTHSILPLLYLAAGLPTVLSLCFLIPPMQSRDEGRHFLRACQIANGQWVSQVNPATGEAGGVLPIAASEFVREKMNPEFLRAQSDLPTVYARIGALDRSATMQTPLTQETFISFPSAAIYPPTLYLPQAIGIRISELFTQKIYVHFYAARVVNALIGMLLIAAGLLLAPSHQYLLLLPAVLPISLYQLASVSTDAGVISLAVFFVSLCLRFEHSDNLALRISLFLSLFLLTLCKPVYLPLALLVFGSLDRLGWQRAFKFFSLSTLLCLASYLAWLHLVRAIAAAPLIDAPGRDPGTQFHTLVTNPGMPFQAFLAMLKNDGGNTLLDVVGFFGWFALPLPNWFYLMTFGAGLAVACVLLLNIRTFQVSRLTWACFGALGISTGVVLATYVLWTPPESEQLRGLQGRYFIPALVGLLFAAPPASKLAVRSARCIQTISVVFFLLSAIWTSRIVSHYYFPTSRVLGRNVHELYGQASDAGCPAALDFVWTNRFSFIEAGRAMGRGSQPRVVLSDDHGAILGESDPAFTGGDSSSWRVNAWMPDKPEQVDSWLIQGSSACRFDQRQVEPHSVTSN